jgi:hypothetical protein
VVIPITSTPLFDDWTVVFGNEPPTGALLDRLSHHGNILAVKCEGYVPFATASRIRIAFCYRMHLRTGRSQEICKSLEYNQPFNPSF